MEHILYLISTIIFVLLVIWLIFNNYELRQKNHNLLIDNSNLFHDKSTLTWHLDQAKHELRLFKAEFCNVQTKNKVRNEQSSLAKS